MKKPRIVLFSLIGACCLIGLALLLSSPVSEEEAAEETITVFTSILPQEYFVQRIGGNRVNVQALVPPGRSPATYEPSPRQLAALSRAKLFFRIGVPFENVFLPKIESSTEDLRVVDTRKGITLRGQDPHIWLSPKLVRIQARTIAGALTDLDPQGKDLYETNLAAFEADLDALDARLAEALAPVRGKTLMVFHPAWGYFADAYGLNQQAIELEGKEPGGKQLVRMVEMARANNVRVIFVQPQFDMGSAEHVAREIGGAVLPMDPLAREYIDNLETVAAEIHQALRKQE